MTSGRIAAGGTLISLLSFAACAREQTHATAEAPALRVQVAVVALRSEPDSFRSGGTVRARTTATLVSRLVAEVRSVLVQPGDRIRTGQPLVRLDDRGVAADRRRADASLAAARQGVEAADADRRVAAAAVALATSSHDRIASLHARNSATAQELDEAVAALRGAEARVGMAEARAEEARRTVEAARAATEGASVALSDATISAPFDGVVVEKRIEPGNMAGPGVPLLVVEDWRMFRLEVKIDEARAASVVVGGEVPVELAGEEAPLSGRVAEISRALDPAAHAALVKVDLPPDARVRAGMFGYARFSGRPQPTLTVPAESVLRNGQLATVFVVGSDARARLRLVSTADAHNGRIAILAGVVAGERVVVRPPADLVDGRAVAVTAVREEGE